MKLRECPFCGEERIFLNPPSSIYPKGSINCPACLACMPGEVDERELIASWNQRADADEIAAIRAALSQEREAREKAEKERDIKAELLKEEFRESARRADKIMALKARLAEAELLLKPFAAVDVPSDLKWTHGTFILEHEAIRAAARFLAQEPNHER